MLSHSILTNVKEGSRKGWNNSKAISKSSFLKHSVTGFCIDETKQEAHDDLLVTSDNSSK